MDVDVMCGWYAMAIGCILHTYVRGRVWVVIDRCLWRSTFPVYYATGESEIPSLHMLITPNVKGIIREGEERIVRVGYVGMLRLHDPPTSPSIHYAHLSAPQPCCICK